MSLNALSTDLLQLALTTFMQLRTPLIQFLTGLS